LFSFNSILPLSEHQDKYLLIKGNSFVDSCFAKLGSNHFQGCQRLNGGNYFLVSGNSPSASHLYIVELEVTDHTSILNTKGRHQVVKCLTLSTDYTHVGGFQVCGDFVALGLEDQGSSVVQVYDFLDPLNPIEMEHLHITRSKLSGTTHGSYERRLLPYCKESKGDPTAGAVGLTRMHDGFYLLAVGRWDSAIIDFYVSSHPNLRDPQCEFRYKVSWRKDTHKVKTTINDTNFGKYQNLNLFVQHDEPLTMKGGIVYLIGTCNTLGLVVINGRDFADLFRVELEFNEHDPVGSISVTKVAKKHVTAKNSNFAAAAGVYVDHNQNFAIYSVKHYTFEDFGGGDIPFEEFRSSTASTQLFSK